MIYLVIYILIGTALLLITHEEFKDATERHDLTSSLDQALTAFVAIGFWPFFLLTSLVRYARGEG